MPLFGGGPELFLLFPLLRTMRTIPRTRITISATPPTAPPTIAPMGVDDFEEAVDEVVVGADDDVLDPAEDVVELPPLVLVLVLPELELVLVLVRVAEASN